ncbi:hypothetical protein GCM10010344_02750 [Streptomyces bluensis]|nr:hypothetical protein GCM10010344_02750 [Streptomyces bluensis]
MVVLGGFIVQQAMFDDRTHHVTLWTDVSSESIARLGRRDARRTGTEHGLVEGLMLG